MLERFELLDRLATPPTTERPAVIKINGVNYRVEKILGQGDNAYVFLIVEPLNRTAKAMKVFASNLTIDETRIKQEVDLTRLLYPETIIANISVDHQELLKSITATRSHCITAQVMLMPYFPWPNLAEKLDSQATVLADPVALVIAIIKNIRHLYQTHGIFHGDLKLGNILCGPLWQLNLIDLSASWNPNQDHPMAEKIKKVDTPTSEVSKIKVKYLKKELWDLVQLSEQVLLKANNLLSPQQDIADKWRNEIRSMTINLENCIAFIGKLETQLIEFHNSENYQQYLYERFKACRANKGGGYTLHGVNARIGSGRVSNYWEILKYAASCDKHTKTTHTLNESFPFWRLFMLDITRDEDCQQQFISIAATS